MKVAYLFVLAVAAVLADDEITELSLSSRTNIDKGLAYPEDRLLTNVIIRRAPTLCAIATTFTRSIAPNVITAVRGFEVGASQFASAEIVAGGVGDTFIAVRLLNAPGRGFDYQVQLWGRPQE